MNRQTPPNKFRLPAAALMRGRRIGLLGGSFNPAHKAHLEISLHALKYLKLDEVWWLVSPQNPLKKSHDMAPYAMRVKFARGVAQHKKIRVSEIENILGTRFTVDTLTALRRKYPATSFVWLMGSDNLKQFHKWRDFSRIAQKAGIAVFARPKSVFPSLSSPAFLRLSRKRLNLKQKISARPGQTGIVFIPSKLNSLSATRIRATTSGVWWQ